jgi:predicted permease
VSVRPDLPDDPRRPVRDEIAFHLEKQVADLMAAGWSESDAREEAARRFGDQAAIERELVSYAKRRGGRMRRGAELDELIGNLAFAMRQIRKRPGFAVAAVLLLGGGIGLGSATFTVVDAALVRPLPFPEAERLVYLRDVQDEDDYDYPASLPELRDWSESAAFLSTVAGVGSNSVVLTTDVPSEIEVGWVWGDWPGVLGLPLVVGRSWTAEEAAARAPVVVLDEEAWHVRWGADPAVIGASVVLDDEPHTVIGVLASEARVLAGQPRSVAWMIMPELDVMGRGLHFLDVIGRLRPSVDLEVARQRAEVLARGLRADGVTRHGFRLRPAREVLLRDAREPVLVLAGAALLVLLVVCVNLTILFAARTQERLREFAVRGALGAASGRIVRQVLTEALVLGGLAGVLGVVTGWALTALLASSGPGPLEEVVRGGDVRTVAFAAALALLAALVVGWAPARTATGPAPGRLLLHGASGRLRAGALRRLLVGFEVALSVVLLTSAGLLLRSVDRLLDIDPGFEPRGAITAWVTLPERRYPPGPERVQLWDEFLARVRALPGVESAGAIDIVPLGGNDTSGGIEIVGREFPEGEGPHAKKRFTGPGALEALGVGLLSGRTFTEADALGAPEVAVVSRSVAERWWPGEDAVGKRIRFLWRTQAEQEIVGVVDDVRSDALETPEPGTVYVSYRQLPVEAGAMSVVVRGAPDAAELAEPIRLALESVAPGVPLGTVASLQDMVSASLSDRTRITGLLSVFAAVALLLAVVGLYAVTARSVGSRRREIGIRQAIGAGRAAILRMVLAEETPAVAIGLLVGVAASVPAARILGSLLYSTEAGDLPTLVAVTLTLGAAAAAALTVPAWRAARTSPATAVRD